MMQKLNYIRCGDYNISDIRLPEENRPIGGGVGYTEIISKRIVQSALMILFSAASCGLIWLT